MQNLKYKVFSIVLPTYKMEKMFTDIFQDSQLKIYLLLWVLYKLTLC